MKKFVQSLIFTVSTPNPTSNHTCIHIPYTFIEKKDRFGVWDAQPQKEFAIYSKCCFASGAELKAESCAELKAGSNAETGLL
jgi:hypothetical protein|tara:strand:+ start:1142 stop:1387 length:246 start_codon:yes stop_codon:yes gene_type:complete